MDKKHILEHVMKDLNHSLSRKKTANELASAGATDSESRAETKWDTSGLESSYLARGYAKQFEEMANQYDQLRSFQLKELSGQPIALGSLVKCDLEGFSSWFFLLPCCGGMELQIAGEEVTVITPESPLGRELSNKNTGEAYVLPNGRSGSILQVL